MKALVLLLCGLSLFASAPYVSSTMTIQELNKLTASDAAANDRFGHSVAISGDTAIVGAYGDDDGGSESGSAYIYLLNHNTGLFEQTAKLTASDANTSDQFGYSVAISGDTVIVGAYQDDDGGNNSGSAYLFEKPDDGWETATQTAKLTASDAAAFDKFGYSVAISGDTVIVGAYLDDDGGHDSGSAYLFEKPATGWANATQTAKLTASDAAANDKFGVSVAISGNTAIVGANWDDDGGSGSGSAYLFEKPLSSWIDANQTAKLTASDAAASDFFGYSVAISGDTVIVGAYYDDDGGSSSGSAYLFEKPLTDWATATETAKLTASDAAALDYFGVSVAISGDTVIVGSSQGSAYLFEKPVSGWATATQTAKLTASDAAASNSFGRSVAISGDTVIVGADQDADGGYNSGSAYIFKNALSENTLENKRDVVEINASDDDAGDTISFSILSGEDASHFDIDAVSGLLSFKNAPDFETPLDANGDNIYRVTLKISDDLGESSITQAYIRVSDMFYEGKAPKAISFKELNKLTASNAMDNAEFGYSVAISGDTAVVGALGQSGGAGNAYIYEYNSSTNLFTQTARLRASDNAAGDYFGISVAISGETVIVGAYQDNDGDSYSSGSAYIFEKPLTGWETATETAKLTASDAATGDFFGVSVAISGNTVIVGANWDDDGGSGSGSAYLFEKPTTGWATATQTAKFTASDPAEEDLFGVSVAISGNTVIVGANWDDDGGSGSGSAYLFEKPAAGWTTATQTAKLTASDAAAYDYFGLSVAISGDTVIVGAWGDDDGGSYSGSAYLFEKPLTGWETTTQTAKLTASDANDSDQFGQRVAISGDTVIVGAYYDDDGGNKSGSAYLFEKPVDAWMDANETAKLTASDAAAYDQFGVSVAISGDTVIVGANKDDDGGSSSGSAYIYKAKKSLSASPALIMYLLQ